MSSADQRARRLRQIELLLGYRRVGPLTAQVIAVNLDAAEDEIAPILAELVREGRLVEMGGGRYLPADQAAQHPEGSA